MTGALKAKVGGQWVLASSATGGGGAEEVYVGPSAPLGTEEIWYDTDAVGITPDDLRWNSAWGIILDLTVLSGQSTTGSVDLTGMVATFTPVVGRKYRYSIKTDITTTVPGDIVVLSITDGTTQVDRHTGRLGGTASETWAWSTKTETFATTTPVTRKVTLIRASGTGTISTQADATLPTKFLVEDMGPVAGASLPNPITALDRWNTAWGVIALSATASVNCTAPNTNTRLSPDVTFTSLTGRRYRISQRISSTYISVGPGTSCGIATAIMEGAAVIGDGDQWMWVGGPGYSGGLLETYLVGNGATRTVRSVCEAVNSGNGTTVVVGCQALVVEDLGPVSGAVAIADPSTVAYGHVAGVGTAALGSGRAMTWNPATLAGRNISANANGLIALVAGRYQVHAHVTCGGCAGGAYIVPSVLVYRSGVLNQNYDVVFGPSGYWHNSVVNTQVTCLVGDEIRVSLSTDFTAGSPEGRSWLEANLMGPVP